MIEALLKKHKLLVGYMLLMTVLLYARDIGNVNFSKMVFVVIMFTTSLFCDLEKLLAVITFTLPLACGLPCNYLLPIWTVLLIIKLINSRQFSAYKAIIFVAIIALAEIAHYAIYPYPITFINYVSYICSLALTAILAVNNINIDYKIPIFTFCIGCCVLLIILFLIYTEDPTLMFSEGGFRMGDAYIEEDEGMTLRTNANSVGYWSIACIACSIVLFYYKKLMLIPFLILFALSFYCGMFSVSRTWMISIVLTLITFLIFNKENKKIGYALIIFLVGGIIVFTINVPDLLQMFVDRFSDSYSQEDSVETGGGRTILFARYNNFLFNHFGNFLFGTGAIIYKDVTGIYESTHNSLQQIWISYGILGFTYFIVAFGKVIIKNYTQSHYMTLLPMLVLIFFLQTIQILNPHYGMYALIAAFLVMKMVKQDNENGLIS